MNTKTIGMFLVVFGLAGNGTFSVAADGIDSTGPTSTSGPTNPTPPTLPTPGTGVDADTGSDSGVASPDESPTTGTDGSDRKERPGRSDNAGPAEPEPAKLGIETE